MTAQPNSSEFSWIREALGRLSITLDRKNSDCRIDGEFSNFEYASELSGSDVLGVMLTQIGIKLGGLKGLPEEVYNEPKLDTYKDLAGYAVILYAYVLSQTENSKWTEWQTPEDQRTNLLEGYEPDES